MIYRQDGRGASVVGLWKGGEGEPDGERTLYVGFGEFDRFVLALATSEAGPAGAV